MSLAEKMSLDAVPDSLAAAVAGRVSDLAVALSNVIGRRDDS